MAEQEIVKIINIKTDQAINTVKELKSYINELRDDLVKVDKNSKEYEETLEEIAKAQTKLTEVTRDSKNAMNYAEGSYKALNQELVNLRNEYRNLSAEERNNAEVGGAMLQRITELDSELKSIDATMGNFQRNVGDYTNSINKSNIAFQTQRQELKQLKAQIEQLTPGTKEYIDTFNRMATITHNLAEQQEMLKYSSADVGNQLSNIRGIASNMAAGFSAVNAAMGLFGEKNEDVAKALLKVQQAMALVQGLQGLDGLLKRTQGLSTAMKVWLSTTKQVTTATQAETVATNAQTVATNTATVAQKGLNAAMKANPIGVVLTAVMAIVTAFTLFGSKIKEAIKGNEKFNQTLAKLKGTLAAAGAAIKNYFLVPLKEVLNAFGTVGKVMIDVFTGQWGKIGEDIKAGVNNAKTIVVDAVNEVETAYDETVKKHLTKRERERAADRANDLQELKDHNEAKYGSDWKYTKDGKALYDEYFENLKSSYKEDSKEYKKAVNDKLSYDREYAAKQKKAEEESTKKVKEEEEKRKKAAEEAKKERERIEKDYQTKIQKQYGTTIRETVNNYKEELKSLQDYLEVQLKVTANTKDAKDQIQKVLNQVKNALKEANEINIFDLENASVGLEKSFDSIKKIFNARFNDAINKSSEEAQRKINDEIIRLFEKTIQPDLNTELAKLQRELDLTNSDFNIKKFILGTDEEGEIQNAFENTRIKLEGLNTELQHYKEIISFVDENNLLPSDEYDKAVARVEELNTEINNVTLEGWQKRADISKTYFQKSLDQIDKDTKNAIAQFEIDKSKNGGLTIWEMLGGANPEEEQKEWDSIYQIEMDGLQRIKDLWDERRKDQNISYEERLNAEEEFQNALLNIQQKEAEQQQHYAEFHQKLIQERIDMTKEAVSQIANLFGSLADIYEEDIKAKQKAGKMSDKEADRAFESVKGMRIAEAVINTLAGSIGAFLQASATYPPPYGQIIGGVTAAAVAASGIAQIAKIKNSSRDGSSSSAASSASVPAPDTSYDYKPMYVSNTTGQQDTEYLRNSLTEQPIRAYVVESDISTSQELAKKRNGEADF